MFAKLIGLLKEEQNSVAHRALKVPPGPDKSVEFEYGKSIGYYQGLEAALSKVEQVLKDQDARDF
jgi:hypothetical protein